MVVCFWMCLTMLVFCGIIRVVDIFDQSFLRRRACDEGF